MQRSKKPAIATQWRENQQAQELAERQERRAARRAARQRFWDACGAVSAAIFTGVGWIVALTVAALLAVALWSYHPTDSGFSQVNSEPVANLCGLAGAWCADLLRWSLGLSSWWLPLIAMAYGLRWLRHRLMEGEIPPARPLRGLLGLIFLLPASSGLESLRLTDLSDPGPQVPGGLLGQETARLLSVWLGPWGLTLLLAVVLVCSLGLVFRFSWLAVAERLGACFEYFCAWLRRRRLERETRTNTSQALDLKSAVRTEQPAQAVAARKAPEATSGTRRPAERPRSAAATASERRRLAPDEAPGVDLLNEPPAGRDTVKEESARMTSRLIESKLQTYRVDAKVVGYQVGPVITQYWLDLAPGVRGSSIENIRKDLTRALAAPSVRVVESIPGTTYMGLEIPNGKQNRLVVYLRELIGSPVFARNESPLTLALGKDIAGKPLVVDLARLPHLLVGGTTGSGKSVAINAMILSLLYKSRPNQLRLVLIDPKAVEFSLYRDIPHLLCPVVTDMSKAGNALSWLVREMERRYAIMNEYDVRHFLSYNKKVSESAARGPQLPLSADQSGPSATPRPLPYIVCFIDELADLILTNRDSIETAIIRLAQKARAAGIHLVLATQRPSADIVTSKIKANITARCCFQVASRFDSQVVLDEVGAQDLLGHGDMLLKLPGVQSLIRVQSCLVEEGEVSRVAEALKEQGRPEYVDAVTATLDEDADSDGPGMSGEDDSLYDRAIQIVVSNNRPTTSFLQRQLSIGYNRAANLIERMEKEGLVSRPNAAGKREVLARGPDTL